MPLDISELGGGSCASVAPHTDVPAKQAFVRRTHGPPRLGWRANQTKRDVLATRRTSIGAVAAAVANAAMEGRYSAAWPIRRTLQICFGGQSSSRVRSGLPSCRRSRSRQAVDNVLNVSQNGPPTTPDYLLTDNSDKRTQYAFAVHWWYDRMVTVPRPFQEKMALFWHGHFVSVLQDGVRYVHYMMSQIQALSSNAGRAKRSSPGRGKIQPLRRLRSGVWGGAPGARDG